VSRTLTYEFVKNFIEIESGSGCKLISTEYVNNHTFLDVQCSCGNTFNVGYDAFRNCNVRRCKECTEVISKLPKVRETYEDVKKYIEATSKSNCILLTKKEDYKTKRQKLELQCSCGNHFQTAFQDFKARNKRKCNECSFTERSEGAKLTYETVKEEIEGENGNGCKLLSTEYVNAHTKLKIQCACGEIYECTINDFNTTNQKQCKACGYANGGFKHRWTIEEMDIYVKENSDCKLVTAILGEYKEQITFECKCGKLFSEQFSSFVSGGKCCPACSRLKSSKGEIAVKQYLEDNNIIFTEQHSFPDCKHLISLQYDFAIYDDNSIIIYLIEYDGSLHYTTTEFFGGEKRLLLQQKRDRIKDKYCMDNNIPLIRIPYWDFDNIKSILDRDILQIKEAVNHVIAI